VSFVVVMVDPQDLVNIASVVRAMKNFGLRDLRLVRPEQWDVRRVEGIAHKSGDLLKRVREFETFDDAIADCTHVAGLTARQRTAKRNVQRPRDAARELWAAAAGGRTAIVLGPEDRGLSNEQLDRCHRSIVIPTNPEYQALNLSHAFAVMAYELYVARGEQPFKAPRRTAPLATAAELQHLFEDAETTLRAVDFLKSRNPAVIMRTLREVAHRAPLDRREVKLLRAMCREVVRYLERMGVR
jgi:TrmH family RNA methyltransferase